MERDFFGNRVLIAEDDYLLAQDLAEAFRAANAQVIGPYSNLQDAIGVSAEVQMAVLDVDLQGQLVFPLADELAGRGVPFLFYTGYDQSLLPARFSDVICLNKSYSAPAIVIALSQTHGCRPVDIADLVPQLRLHASRLMRDVHAGDRLLEATLRDAIDDPDPMPPMSVLLPWLEARMHNIFHRQKSRVLH